MSTFQSLSPEILLLITSFLDVKTLLQFSCTSKAYAHLITDEQVYRGLVDRAFRVSYKNEAKTWRELYKQLSAHQLDLCPHLSLIADDESETKRIVFRALRPTVCDVCSLQPAVYLSMSPDYHTQACSSCLVKLTQENEVFPIQLDTESDILCCFKCKKEDQLVPYKLGQSEEHQNDEKYKVDKIVNFLKAPAADGDMDRRRKAEHQLYIQELRREDMTLKHYLIEKQWGRAWMLFRTREGSPLPGRITNQKLSRSNGTLDPNIRLPMDKYRPSPETHADIVSEKLWSFLSKTYGVQGGSFNEDNFNAPEFARLRIYMDDFKKSINLYP